MSRTVLPGKPYPLGATWDGEGVNFSIYSENATGVELCLFTDPETPCESERVSLREVTAHVWHAYLPGICPGQVYGYRVSGPYEPMDGLRFNHNKMLLDPYAKAITGKVAWDAAVFGYQHGHPALDRSFDERDDVWGKPRAVVIDPTFDWGSDEPPQIPWADSIIYEAHVKGFTMQNPDVPPELRGTYVGLSSPASLDYLRRLGVTAVELLPVHAALDDKHLVDRGMTNYWGYNTIGFFAPDPRLACKTGPCEQVNEFKQMVKALHGAGLEVILDVVYNHTAEGNEFGPTLSLRGIDNPTYYHLVPDQGRYYLDYTGTGNSLNVRHPQVLKLIMDSLRYWVLEMHVDGFRFDLAAALARELHDVDRLASFFDIIHQDPILSQVKLIAEPWDVGPGGYQVGNFPVLWTEWNGEYRDTVRRFWRGDPGQIGDLARRLSGSSDLYQADGRSPSSSINFVTCHDGFTLHDLVSYERKHNEANGEQNRDGSDGNLSSNYGAEGPTDDAAINDVRQRQMRNFLTTLLLSQGVPMLSGGDEVGRTQRGNNNAYCQDNPMSWYSWEVDPDQERLLELTRFLIHIRRQHNAFRHRKFLRGEPLAGSIIPDVTWFRPDGQEPTPVDWNDSSLRCLGMRLGGRSIDEVDEHGRPIVDDTFMVFLNAHDEPVQFRLPPDQPDSTWQVLIDTSRDYLPSGEVVTAENEPVHLDARSMIVLSTRDGG